MIKTYIINLACSVARKASIGEQLLKYPFLNYEFVTGVDGRLLTEQERESQFDAVFFHDRYAHGVLPGEIGCTLSHQRCYRQLLSSGEPYALILEDDVVLGEGFGLFCDNVRGLMDTERPCITLLSGSYWYTGSRPFMPGYKLTCVYDAFGAYAYVINRSAARLLLDARPGVVADDWRYAMLRGISVFALQPHIAGVNEEEQHPSTISHVRWHWDKGRRARILRIYLHEFVLKLFELTGKFEKIV